MRRRTALYIVFIFLLASLSGCGSQTENSTGTTPATSAEASTTGKPAAGERLVGVAWYPDLEIEFISYVTRAIEVSVLHCSVSPARMSTVPNSKTTT